MKKLLSIIYIIFLGTLCGMRFMISENFVDYTTGFYTYMSPVITVQNIILIASLVLFIVLPVAICRDRYELTALSKASGACLMIFSSGISAYTVLQIFNCRDSVAMLMSSNWASAIVDLVSLILSALTAVGFMFAGVLGAMGNTNLRGCEWTFAMSVLWVISMAAVKFIEYTTVLTASEQLFELMFYLATALFLLGHFAAMCKLSTGKRIIYTIIGGFMGSIFSALLITDMIQRVVGGYVFTLSDVSKIVLFGVFFLYELYFSMYSLFKSKVYVRRISEPIELQSVADTVDEE